MKEENYLWHIGRFHHAHMGQSIPWIVIGWIISLDMLVHKYQPSVQLKLLILWISWTSGKCCCYYYRYYCCCVLLPSTVLLFILHLLTLRLQFSTFQPLHLSNSLISSFLKISPFTQRKFGTSSILMDSYDIPDSSGVGTCRIIIALSAIISMQWRACMWTVRCSVNSPPSPQVVVIFSGQLCLLHNWILVWKTSQIWHGAANRIHDTRRLGTFLHWIRHIHRLVENSGNKVYRREADNWETSDAGSIYAEGARSHIKGRSPVHP